MKQLERIVPPQLGWLTVTVGADAKISFVGTIAVQNPAAELGPFFKTLHQAIVDDGLKEVAVDVTKLTFVNSSAIRLLVDWSTWIRKESEGRRYRLKFLIDPQVTWQKTSFPVLKSLAPGVVATEP